MLLGGTKSIIKYVSALIHRLGLVSIPGQPAWDFVVDRVAMEQVFLRERLFSNASIIPSEPLTLHVAPARRTNRRSPGNFPKSNALS